MLIGVFQHLGQYNISAADWLALEGNKNISEILFACFATANLYYSLFSKLLKGSSPHLQVSDNTGYYISATHYDWYSELVRDLCKSFDLNYNKDNNDIDYEENMRDKKDDGTTKENNKRDGEDG